MDSRVCYFQVMLICSVTNLVIAADYNDTIICSGSSTVNTITNIQQYGQCITYPEHDSHTALCDAFYTPGVDTIFLPNGRAHSDINVLINFATRLKIFTDVLQEPCQDVSVRLFCYYYLPPCGNTTYFELPTSLCMSTCQYATEDLCQQQWMGALQYLNSDANQRELREKQIGIISCNELNPLSLPVNQFPHCCSNAGITKAEDSLNTQALTESDIKTEVQQSSLTVTIVSSVLSVLILIFVLVVAIVVITVILYKKIVKVILVADNEKESTDHESNLSSDEDLATQDSCSHNNQIMQNTSQQTKRITEMASFYIEQISEADLFISPEQIKLLNTIGQGEFGVVYRGYLTGWSGRKAYTDLVAVKTLKDKFSSKDISDLIEESLKMKSFRHPNVLHLIGVCIDAGAIPYLVMPYMLNGNLLSFLKKERSESRFIEFKHCEPNIAQVTEATTKLLSMCLQIAKGMEYLAEKRFVHRDLAARNCMIDENFVIKVADFGLSEDIYCKDYFRQILSGNTQEEGVIELPIKWMALESLLDGIFTEKTDVWSFGVTCWEVFSLGRSPYPGVDPFTLVKYLEEGKRLDKPNNAACTENVYSVMLKCWSESSEDRPSFTALVQLLSSFLEEIAGYMDFSTLKHDS